jgi:Protein of unknown function (DUF5132)
MIKVFSTLLKLGIGFAGGYVVANVPKERMRPALKQAVKAGVMVQSAVKKAVATVAEETEDILAEIRAEEAARETHDPQPDARQPDAPRPAGGFRPFVKQAVKAGKAAGVNISRAASGASEELRNLANELHADSPLN